MDDTERDVIELAALMARAPDPAQAPRPDADVADLERRIAAARRRRDELAGDVEWDPDD